MYRISSAPRRIPNIWSKNSADSRRGGKSEKQFNEGCRTFILQRRLKRHFKSGCQKPLGTCHHVQNQSRRLGKRTHARASRVSRNPGGNYRQERMDAGQADGRQRADKRVSTMLSQRRIRLCEVIRVGEPKNTKQNRVIQGDENPNAL